MLEISAFLRRTKNKALNWRLYKNIQKFRVQLFGILVSKFSNRHFTRTIETGQQHRFEAYVDKKRKLPEEIRAVSGNCNTERPA